MLYLEMMVLADMRHRAEAVVVPSSRMMKEACKQLGVRCVADNRSEITTQLKYLQLRTDRWSDGGKRHNK